MIEAQQLGQPASIDLVTLVAFFHGGILSRIAHHQFRHVRFQQVVQPGGPGSFFKRDVQVSAQPIDKLQNHAGFRLDHAFHHDLSRTIPHRNRNAFLVDIHTDILFAIHRGRSFLVGIVLAPKPYSKRGALLYCVPTENVTDGWYIDLDTSISCDLPRRPGAFAVLLAGDKGKIDYPTFKFVGQRETGFALATTRSDRLFLPDGSRREDVPSDTAQVTGLSTAPLPGG